MKKKAGGTDRSFEAIRELAESVARLSEQSMVLIRPVACDACRHPETVSQNELEHLFDRLLDIALFADSERLFKRLCRTFKDIYPDSVADYVRILREQTEEDKD